MASEKISRVSGRAVVVPADDIDTDRITPARFLKCVTFDGLADILFWDERHHEDGQLKGHPLDAPGAEGASILVVGRNFGCGSSREHAPQSIYRAGFRALVGLSFAEIFFGNSLTLGMPCVTVSEADHTRLLEALSAAPAADLALDLPANSLTVGDQTFRVQLPDSARDALVAGRWDPLGELREGHEAVRAVHDALPYVRWMAGRG